MEPDKPPIEELQQFLEFQVPRLWAPEFGQLPLSLQRRKNILPSLQFTLMGPKLHVNTAKVSQPPASQPSNTTAFPFPVRDFF